MVINMDVRNFPPRIRIFKREAALRIVASQNPKPESDACQDFCQVPSEVPGMGYAGIERRPSEVDVRFERRGRSRGYAWWYFSISASFLLLAIYFYMRGGSTGPLALRLVISVAFAALGYMQLKSASK